ncbi:TonB-dependent receptor [Nonlabens xiamenensis]|uniref:TonB-dependent receptor n=1 Tax=Nonlabens xiamenensis TaxID=2341043 RepID=UPI000F60D6E9|nr:TonB-dependent receptor [Nonlabens xiamenensis]
MQVSHKLYLFCALLGSTSSIALAQTPEEEEENRLNGGSITVTTSYDPTISDAFKVKSVPVFNDTTKIEKKPVTYSIFSVPVASTFTPVKAGLSKLRPKKREKYFTNYARLGLGNYFNVLGEFAANFEVDRDSDVGVFFNHNSSQGGIQDVVTDDSFSDTSLDVSYGMRNRDFNWGISAGARYQTANWYGSYENTPNMLTEDSDVGLNYLSYALGGKAQFFDGIFKDVDVQFSGTKSGEDASEIRVSALPRLAFEIVDTEVALGLEVDYLQGSFNTQGLFPAPEEYAYLKTGLNPSINLYGDKYKVELGATVNYLNDLELSEGEVFIYPDIVASYALVPENLIPYLNLGGGLDMNSLRSFADENLFLAPAVAVAPTNRQLDAQVGLKGKIAERVGYKVFAGYRMEEGRYFYTKDTGASFTVGPVQPYHSGNVFYTQYADLNTTSYGGALSVDLTTDFNLTLNAQGFSYEVSEGGDFENTASQLPEFTADLVGNYIINDQWSVGTTLYYIGERQVFRNGIGTETLDSFVDLNFDVNYKINPQLSAFLRANNLTGGNYQYYLDYPVQNLQVMAGAVYKFDF